MCLLLYFHLEPFSGAAILLLAAIFYCPANGFADFSSICSRILLRIANNSFDVEVSNSYKRLSVPLTSVNRPCKSPSILFILSRWLSVIISKESI